MLKTTYLTALVPGPPSRLPQVFYSVHRRRAKQISWPLAANKLSPCSMQDRESRCDSSIRTYLNGYSTRHSTAAALFFFFLHFCGDSIQVQYVDATSIELYNSCTQCGMKFRHLSWIPATPSCSAPSVQSACIRPWLLHCHPIWH